MEFNKVWKEEQKCPPQICIDVPPDTVSKLMQKMWVLSCTGSLISFPCPFLNIPPELVKFLPWEYVPPPPAELPFPLMFAVTGGGQKKSGEGCSDGLDERGFWHGCARGMSLYTLVVGRLPPELPAWHDISCITLLGSAPARTARTAEEILSVMFTLINDASRPQPWYGHLWRWPFPVPHPCPFPPAMPDGWHGPQSPV